MADDRAMVAAAQRGRRSLGFRLVALLAGVASGLMPALAGAAGEGRALDRPENFGMLALLTALGAGGLLLLASLGRMYQRQRGIRWPFQDPDQSHGDGH